MRFLKYILFIFLNHEYRCQVEVINTGNTSYIVPSIIGKNILINASDRYLAKSYDECSTLLPLNAPGNTGYSNYLTRIDTSIFYLLSVNFNLYNNKIFKTIDGGYNWVVQKDTSGLYTNICFFDNQEGIAFSTFYKLLRTQNGGNSWTSLTSNIPTYITAVRIFGDSTICIGGIYGSSGPIQISRDRGNTWPIGGGFAYSAHPNDFCFLSKDTILGVSSPGQFGAYFTKTFDGGNSWKNDFIPLDKPGGMTSNSFREIYVVGRRNDGMGMILKTTDLGLTWESFSSGVNSELWGINFINDSIALVSGANGTLFKWNSRQAIFTGIRENILNELDLKIFPNPVKDKLGFEYENSKSENINLSISTLLGQRIYSKEQLNLEEELDISFLEPGIYFVKLESSTAQKSFKIIKE